MIRYQLKCGKGHNFEGWFKNSAAFDAQAKRKLVVCPKCGVTDVEKAVMAPSVARTDRGRSRRAKSPVRDAETVAPPAEAAVAPSDAPSLVNAEQRAIIDKMRALRDKLLSNSEYVGSRFAEEARAIHEQDAPQRSIYGEATPSDVEALHEDGVEVFPIPRLPDDKN